MSPLLRRRRPLRKFSAHNFELCPGRWSLPGEPRIGAEPISPSGWSPSSSP